MTWQEEWITSAPRQWTRGRIKNLITSSTNGTWGDEPSGPEGAVKCIRATDFDRQQRRVNIESAPLRRVGTSDLARHRLNINDLIIEKSGGGEKQPVGMVALYDSGEAAVCSNFCARIVPATGVSPRYLNYAFQAAYSQGLTSSSIKQTTGIQNLDTNALYSASWAYPDIEEQRRIADFLDAETAHLDQIIQLREKSIQLLEERLESEIEKVIKGSSRQRRRAATYHLLGDVPTSWNEGRLRNADCDVQTGPFGSQLHAEDYVSNAWPVINPANIAPSGLVPDTNITVTNEVRDRLSRHILRSGDVIFGRRGELGRAAIVTADEDGWLCGTGCLRLRFRNPEAFHSGYLHRFLGIPVIRHYFRLNAIGSTMANLSTSILMNMPLLMPPISEQVNLARHCEEIERSAVDHVRLLRRQVKLFQERRQALIMAAVTGQFDVSTASGRGVTE